MVPLRDRSQTITVALTGRDKAEFLDGYAVIKAAARATKEQKPAVPPEERAASEPERNARPADRALHVSRTVRPPTHEIFCYECGYRFRLTGKAERTFCPRCRVILDMTDYSLETEWRQPIKTAGRIRLARHAILDGAELVAGEIILEGTVKRGRIHALRKLEIHPHARFDLTQIRARNLTVVSGAALRCRQVLEAHDLDIAGKLEGKVHATGTVVIRSGGFLRGELVSPHLVVEDGGGLKARCTIRPEISEATTDAEPQTGTAE